LGRGGTELNQYGDEIITEKKNGQREKKIGALWRWEWGNKDKGPVAGMGADSQEKKISKISREATMDGKSGV